MGDWLHGCGDPAGTAGLTPGVIGYIPIIGSCCMSTTEAPSQFVVRDSYVWSKLLVRASANTLTANSTLQSRINGAAGTQSVSIPSGGTGLFEDDVNTDNLNSGNLIDWKVTCGGSGTALTLSIVDSILTGSSCIQGASSVYSTGEDFASDEYLIIGGLLRGRTTESYAQHTWRNNSTTSYLRCYVPTNSRNGASVLRFRKNAASGNQNVSIGSAATGAFEDAVNTDDVSAGDEVNCWLDIGGASGTLYMTTMQVKSVSGSRNIVAGDALGQALNPGTTRYFDTEGVLTPRSSETACLGEASSTWIGRNFFVNVPVNTLDVAAVINNRKDSVNGALSVTVGAGATGFFEDLVNTDNYTSEVDISSKSVIPSGTGSATITSIAMEMTTGGGPGGGNSPAQSKAVGVLVGGR